MRGHIVPRFGDLPLARIENADVQAWVAELSARGLAPASVKKIYDVFAKCVQAAVDGQRLPRNRRARSAFRRTTITKRCGSSPPPRSTRSAR